MTRHEQHHAPALRPWAKYSQSPDGLRYRIVDPTAPSPVAHYVFAQDGSRCLRRVLSADGAEVLLKEVVELGDHPRCPCGNPLHAALAAEKLGSLHRHSERRLFQEALWDLEREMRPHPESASDDGEYDGGYLPGGIGWFTDDGQPATEEANKIAWGVDVPRASAGGSGSLPARFLADLAGADDGQAARLAPIVERTLLRTITHPPRVAGGWDDLFQEGMATALHEAGRLQRNPGEPDDRYAARLERRVALAVKHRLIDLVRRQDAAARNLPASSIEAGQAAGIDIPDADDPFDSLFRLPDSREHLARFRAVALAVYRDARGLARRIIRRAYLAAIVGRCSRGTGELRTDPEFPQASRWLADAWGRATAQAMRGAITPAYHRRRKRRAAAAA